MLQTKLSVNLNITDQGVTIWQTQPNNMFDTNRFTQKFGNTVLLPAGVQDQQIHLNGIGKAQLIYLFSDQQVLVKLVPQGQSFATVPYMKLLERLPSLLSFDEIVEIYVSNPTGQTAKLTIHGAGVD